MADESVTFDIKVVGLKDLKEAANTFERTGKVSRQLAAQFKPVGAATERVVNETRKLESIHRKLSKAIEDGIISRKQANNAMDEAIRRSKEAVLTDKNLIEIEKKKARAAEEARKNEERLVKLYAPARAAAREYARTTLEIRNAHRSGAINAEEMAEALATVKREFDEFTQGVATGGNQFAKFNVEAYKAAQRLKRGFNQGLQQAGYQVGDFIVQVQSGQSALVALGQQGSQLAGIFGPYGAVVGALLAAGTAAGTMYLQWKEAAEGARDAVLSLAEAQKLLRESVAGYETEIAKLEFGVDSEAEAKVLREILRLKKEDLRIRTEMAETDSLSTRQRLSKELKEGRVKLQSLEKEAAKHREVRESYENLVRIKGLEESFDEDRMKSLEEYGLAYEEAARRRSTIAAMQGDKELEKSKALAESEARRIDQRFEKEAELFRQTVGMSDEAKRRAEELAADERAHLEYVAQAQAALLEENAKYEESQDKINAKLRDLQIFVSATHKAYIPLSAEASAFKQQVEKSTSDFVDLVNKSNQLKKEIGDAAFEALRLGGVDIVSGVDAAAKAAAILAANMGMSLAAAMAMQAMTSKEDVAMSQPVVQGTVFDRFGVEDLRRFGFTDETLKRFGLLRDGRGGGAGGGKDPYQTAMDYLTTLQREAEFKQQLVGLSEQDQRRMELEYEFREKAEIGTRALTDAENQRIESVLKAEMALQKAAEADQRRAQIQETISSNIESALMSVVDGTQSVEDAFKSMLRNIILEIYRQQVAKPFAESIGTIISGLFANGGVFRNGNVQPFANGGVVSSPSYFPMAGGKTGLMGEAGPEAIMPLKRGKNGKLGVQMEGGGDINIVQNYNFQANGDESVKRIISQETPKIMEMTKAAVADARQRGGSYGRAFR